MLEALLTSVCASGALIVGTTIVCQRLLHKSQGRYEKSKATIEDIVLSFNRQLKREAEKLGILSYKVESINSKSDRAIHEVEQANMQMIKPEDKKEITERLIDLEGKIRDIVMSQEALVAKITSLEDKTKQFFSLPDARIETVIPLKREKALGQLTGTEFMVLEMLLSEGPKTAPEVREKVRLSREHTARLMKKLYEEGYLERQTGRIPFKYSAKKEMRKLLERPNQ